MEAIENNFTIGKAKGCHIVQPHGALPLAQIDLIQQQLLPQMQQSSNQYVIVDLKGVTLIDNVEFNALKKMLTMCGLMGSQPVITSVNYQVASALAQTDFSLDGILIEQSIDTAISKYGDF